MNYTCKCMCVYEDMYWGWSLYTVNKTNPALKGPKHEIFESGFFTQIRGLWLDDLGTGEKIEISKVGVIILKFSPRISY